MSADTILRREPVTQETLAMILRHVGFGGPLIFGTLTDKYGAGVLENGKCVWNTQRHRVTVAMPQSGGLIVSCSNEPDPECREYEP